MRTIGNRKLALAILLIPAAFAAERSAMAYPPDNAAVLYYKACVMYNDDGEIQRALADSAKGKTKPSKAIRDAIENNRRAIEIVLDASEVKDCDWGLDYSKGCEMLAPPFYAFRYMARLIIAEARILAENGDYRTALGRCISVYRMARHVNDRIFVSHLIAVAMEALANDCVITILSEMPQDKETLLWLKGELAEIDQVPLSVQPALYGERELARISMGPERIGPGMDALVEDEPAKDEIRKRINSNDSEFFNKSREYWDNHMAKVMEAFGLPYPKAHSQLKNLEEKLSKEYEKNPHALLAASFCPEMRRICTLSVRAKTHSNAVRAGIEVYMAKAATGSLPDVLPSDAPQDLFSNKPFKYEKTPDGFILRCQGKDMDKDTTYSYEFKVTK